MRNVCMSLHPAIFIVYHCLSGVKHSCCIVILYMEFALALTAVIPFASQELHGFMPLWYLTVEHKPFVSTTKCRCLVMHWGATTKRKTKLSFGHYHQLICSCDNYFTRIMYHLFFYCFITNGYSKMKNKSTQWMPVLPGQESFLTICHELCSVLLQPLDSVCAAQPFGFVLTALSLCAVQPRGNTRGRGQEEPGKRWGESWKMIASQWGACQREETGLWNNCHD